MKKLFLLLTVLLASSSLMAGVTRTIDVATAGSLPDLISESEKYEIEELTLTGELNGTDFRLLRDMAGNNCYGQATEGKLKTLDFSGARVIAGGDMYLDTDRIEGKGFGMSIYPAIHSAIETNNVLPQHLFSGCTLESVIISNSIDEIKSSAFSSCYQLVSVVLPENVVTLGNGIFYQCRLLKNLIIPSRVSSIGTQFISGCTSLESVVVDNQNETYDSRNNCNAIIKKTSNILVAGCSLTVIPEGVVEIGSHAMEDCTFSSIKLPESLQIIGINGFRGCLNLEYITIPAAVATISQGAFSKCKNLKSIVVDSNNQYFDSRNNCNAIIQSTTNKLILGCQNSVIPEGIYTIGSNAFNDGITTMEIPSSITSIESYAFPWSLSSVIMMSETPPVISVNSFPNYKKMMLIVPTGYTDAYTSADYWKDFKMIVDSRPIIFADKTVKALCVANWDTNGDGELSEVEAAAVTDLGTVFKNNKEIKSFDELEYFTGITIIGSEAFHGCTSLTNLTIPSSVTSIGGQAFFGCTSLTNLTIPSSVTSIGAQAFNYCSDLTSIIVEEGNTVFDSRDNCNAIINKVDNKLLFGCMNTIIPNSVASIGEFAFFGCINLTSITIPSNVKTIYSYAFNDCRNLSSLTIDNGLTSIGVSSFIDCKRLTEIVFPNTLVSIGESAFWRCGFTSVTIPANLSSLGYGLFVGCDNLDQIQVSTDNLNYTSEDGVLFNKGKSELICFPKGKKSSNYSIPNSVTKIARFAFHNCTNLASVQISDCLQTIGNSAFGECTSLESIVIPRSVQSIENYAFSNCKALTSVTSELETPFDIEKDVFSGTTSSDPALNVDIYSTAKLYVPIGTSELYRAKTGWSNFNNIEEIDIDHIKQTIHVATAGTLPDLISESKKYTIEELTLTGELNGTDFRLLRDMAGCNYLGDETAGKLKVLDFSGAKVVAGGEKYVDTDHLPGNWGGDLKFSVEKDDILPEHIFHGCKFTTVLLSNSLTGIGHGAFYCCRNLLSITIPQNVSVIEQVAFGKCSLNSILVESGNTTFDSRDDCNAIIETNTNTVKVGCHTTVIPNSVTSIGDGSFRECGGLVSITIPNSVTKIGDDAFRWNEELISVNIPNSVTHIGKNAFDFCRALSSIEIPNSVKVIDNDAFRYCQGLSTITIPYSVTTIGNGAFSECSGFTSVVSLISHPFEISEDVFPSNIYSKAKLIVPLGTKTNYLSTNYWNKFTNIEESGVNEEWPRLPEGYTEVKYIQAPKEVYSSSKVWTVPNNLQENYNYIFEFTPLSWEDNYYGLIIGGNNEGTVFPKCGIFKLDNGWGEMEKRFETVFWNYDLATNRTAPGGNYRVYTGVRSKFQLHCKNYDSSQGAEIVVDNEGYATYTHTSTSIYRSDYSVQTGVYEIPLFTTIDGNTASAAFMQLHNFKVEDQNGKAIYDYVPCVRNSDSRVGLYDVVNRAFYYPSEFTLTAGPEVCNPSATRTIHVATAGTLPDLISESEKYTIEELTLTGELNGTDFRFIRDMAGCNYLGDETAGKLKVLDFSGASIVAGGEKHVDTNHLGGWVGNFSSSVEQDDILPSHLFMGCKLSSVKISDKATAISDWSFALLGNMTSITIPNTVKSIGSRAFQGCGSLTSITIPASVSSIANDAFMRCYAISSISVESGNTIYDSRNNCNAIIETSTKTLILGCGNTIIPDNVVCIGDNAFLHRDGFTSLVLPRTLTKIGVYAFGYCTSLKSVTIPDGVKCIDAYAFEGCSEIETLNIPSEITTIGFAAFRSCSSITSLHLPKSLTSIGDYAFQRCNSLTSIDVDPDNEYFKSDSGILFDKEGTSILCYPASKEGNSYSIPNNVTIIGKCAFGSCSNLTSVNLHNNITTIGDYAFEFCSSLKSITIPGSVTSIGGMAFYNCDGLTSVVSEIANPFEINDNVFTNYSVTVLIVPAGKKSLYQETGGWKNFTNIEEVTLTPMDDQDEINYGEDGNVDGNTNLEGTIIDNVYYNITQENGGFDTEDKCIVVNKSMSDEEIESIFGKDLQSDEVKQTFTGMVIEVPAGKGEVKINAASSGGMTLKVKIGSADPVTLKFNGKMEVTVPYNVIEPTYVYIYAGEATASVRRRSGDESEKNLRIYGLSIDAEEFVKGNVNADEGIDIADAVNIVNFIVGKPTSAFIKAAADVNGDGVIDIADAVRVVNLIVGKINAFARQRDVTLPDPE